MRRQFWHSINKMQFQFHFFRHLTTISSGTFQIVLYNQRGLQKACFENFLILGGVIVMTLKV